MCPDFGKHQEETATSAPTGENQGTDRQRLQQNKGLGAEGTQQGSPRCGGNAKQVMVESAINLGFFP